jgi:hypothetical protein
LADKRTTLLLDALGRAAVAPAGTPLVATKTAPGLFPGTAAARQVARRALDDGLLCVVTPDQAGKSDRDLVAATEQGRAFLFEHTSPKQVLEDLVRALETRHEQVAGLIATARQMQTTLDAIKGVVTEILPSLAADDPGSAAQRPATIELVPWADDLCDQLAHWHDSAPGDCPLPDLYRSVRAAHADLTIGRFHDGLRVLQDRGRVYLHPWTGPLYAMPEPAFALLVGHEIAYYASLRSDKPLAISDEPDTVDFANGSPTYPRVLA